MLISELISLAIELDLPEQHEQVITGVMRWLKEHDNWLLIFDNVEDVRSVYDLLPTAYRGHILLLWTRLVPISMKPDAALRDI